MVKCVRDPSFYEDGNHRYDLSDEEEVQRLIGYGTGLRNMREPKKKRYLGHRDDIEKKKRDGKF